MRIIGLFFIIINLVLFNCKNLRSLKLSYNQDNINILTQIAEEASNQIYKVKADFQGVTYTSIGNDKNKVTIVVDDSPSAPTETNVIFNITKDQVLLPELEVPPNLNLDIFGANDLKEEFKIFSNMVAAAYQKKEKWIGYVVIYKKKTDGAAQNRYKCFVERENGEKIGAFEISQQDINDSKTILEKLESFYQKIKNILKNVNEDVKLVAETITTTKGIVKDLTSFSSSSFLKNSIFLSLILLALL